MKVYKKYKAFPVIVKYVPNGGMNGYHVCAHSNGNAGDDLLPTVLRDLFNFKIGVKKWSVRGVGEIVNEKEVADIQKKDFLVIGGGGLFLKDTNPNNLSGWQWSCGLDSLEKIRIPIIMFAVGYNRFRGQDDFEPIFKQHLNVFVRKASFVGLRNHGSIEKLKNYLETEELKKKLIFQPCMTTLISRIYPALCDYNKKENIVAINCAFDRSSMRNLSDSILESIAQVAQNLAKKAKIICCAHCASDFKVLPFLDKYGVVYEKKLFKTSLDMIKCYAKSRLVIGMRGHAQMVPFGCKTPILSIVSHDKMQWFLDDIHHPEWGVDVNNPDFSHILQEKATLMFENYFNVVSEIDKQQEYLWAVTEKNLNFIKEKINENAENHCGNRL